MKVAIIGAGPSGLCAAKEILSSSHEHDVCIFESSGDIGGVFAKSYKGLHLVNNNYLISFSDFMEDINKSKPRIWSTEEYVDYLKKYANEFSIHQHIQFTTRVVSVKKIEQQWEIETVNKGNTEKQMFDYLVVTSGVHQCPVMPEIINMENFCSKIIHVNDIDNYENYKGKDVVIIGMGESASDISYFISKFAKSVTVSIRRWPGLLIPRTLDGIPTDYDTSRLHHSLSEYPDFRLSNKILSFKRKLEKKSIFCSEDLNIQEKINEFNNRVKSISIFQRSSTKSESFVRGIIENNIQVKPRVVNVDRKKVIFRDGTSKKTDIIICCSGYKADLSFLPKDLENEAAEGRNIYKYIYPLTEQSLAFIGFIRPGIGSIPPLSELQARHMVQVLDKKIVLPRYEEMLKATRLQYIRDKKQFPVDSNRLGSIVNYYTYINEMTAAVGCKPSKLKLLIKSPKLFYKYQCSFICPAQFRLKGPGCKEKESADLIKKLPVVKFKYIVIEFIAWLIARFLSIFL